MNNCESRRPKKLFGFLTRSSPNRVFISIVLGILAGLAYALIIPLVTQSIEFSSSEVLRPVIEERLYLGRFEVSSEKYALAFFLLCLFILAARITSSVLLQWVAINATLQLRVHIYKRISQLPIMDLERIGPSRLHAAIANDVPGVMGGAAVVPTILTNVATIVGLLGFLIYLNVHVFLFVMGTIVFGIATYRIPLYFGNRSYSHARETLDSLQEGIRGLIYGAKELKLNLTKQQAYIEKELVAPEYAHRNYSERGSLLVAAAVNYGNLVSLLAIGIVTFVISNHYAIAAETLASIIMAMLYIAGPLGGILNSISPVLRGSIALKKLNALLDEMPIEDLSAHEEIGNVHQIELRDVRLTYPPQDDAKSGFAVGPVSLVLRRGEVTFVVGGNGSGKSTLGKVLSLHYVPQEGSTYFDGRLVTKENRDQYRRHISAIYPDFYLFRKLYGISEERLENVAPCYLKHLDLERTVAIHEGYFSTTALSDGHKKRLALLVMYLDDRDIYIFDEWAADQDPQFKEVFYSEILRGLRKAGKLVVVITHDDRYYHLADNIIRMEDGQIIAQESAAGQQKPANISS